MSSAGTHSDWLNQRNRIFDDVAMRGDASNGDDEALLALEAVFFAIPAKETADVVAKLVLVAQLAVEGFEPDPEIAAAVIREAWQHFGLNPYSFGLGAVAESRS